MDLQQHQTGSGTWNDSKLLCDVVCQFFLSSLFLFVALAAMEIGCCVDIAAGD